MSDHGAGRFSGAKIHVDEVLKKEELFFLREFEGKKFSGIQSRFRLSLLKLLGEGKRTLTRRLSSETKDAILKLLPGVQGKFATISKLSAVDWPKTKVYPGENVDFLRLNFKGKLPQGAVTPGPDSGRIIDHTIKTLESLRHPESNEKLVEKVFRREDLYHGPYAHEGPDLIIWTKDYQHAVRADLTKSETNHVVSFATDESEPSGTHRLNGILVAAGSHIKPGIKISSAHIIDLFPTILYAMGCPIPGYCDGKVLSEVFMDEYFLANPATYIDMDMDKTIPVSSQTVYSDDDNKEIEQQLKDLGYL
jgi:predicted AlkP superfamily phosphohydrolase/phosphomutase